MDGSGIKVMRVGTVDRIQRTDYIEKQMTKKMTKQPKKQKP